MPSRHLVEMVPMIVGINKGGYEFSRAYLKKLDYELLHLGWQEYVDASSLPPMNETFTFHKDGALHGSDPKSDLRDLQKLDPEIFEELSSDPSFSHLLHAYLGHRLSFEDTLFDYFSSHYCLAERPQHRNMPLEICIIADLNAQDDFILVNGLAFSLERVVPTFFNTSNVRVFLISPEVETDLVKGCDQIRFLYRNLNLFHLIRRHVKYKLHVLLCHGSSKDAWQFAFHIIQGPLCSFVQGRCGEASTVMPFPIHLPDDQEKDRCLRCICDIALAQMLSSPSGTAGSNRRRDNPELQHYLRDQAWLKMVKRARGLIRRRFRKCRDFGEFDRMLKGIGSRGLESAQLVCDAIVRDYINGFVDMAFIEKFDEDIQENLSSITTLVSENDLQNIREAFLTLKETRWLKYFFASFVKKDFIPLTEIENLLKFHYRSVYLRKVKGQLSALITGIAAMKREAESTLEKMDFIHQGMINHIGSHIKDTYLITMDDSKIRADFCENVANAFQLNEKARSDMFAHMDRLIIRDALERKINLGQILLLLWKADWFPWSNHLDFRLFSVADSKDRLEYLRSFFPKAVYCNFLKKKAFEDSYRSHENNQEPFHVICEQRDSEESGIIIYIHAGSFPLEAILFREYRDVIRKSIFESRMLQSLIKNNPHMETILPFYNELNICGPEESGNISSYIQMKQVIMNMDLSSLKEHLQDLLDKAVLNREPLVDFINSLSRIEAIEKCLTSGVDSRQ